jgi:hypothetical protein
MASTQRENALVRAINVAAPGIAAAAGPRALLDAASSHLSDENLLLAPTGFSSGAS